MKTVQVHLIIGTTLTVELELDVSVCAQLEFLPTKQLHMA